MKTSASHLSRKRFLIHLFFLPCGLALTSCGPTNVLAKPAPTHLPGFAQVIVPKPAYTFTPPPTATQVPLPTATESGVYVEVVADTPTAEPPPAPEVISASYTGNKSILIDISEQHLYAYEAGTLVYSFVASTGMNSATSTGTFSVLDKIPNAYGATWDIWMPDWLGIYYAGSLENGIHALPILPNGATLWAGYLGVPISYGCIVLGTDEAQTLYQWADVGMPVEIQW